MNRRQFLAGAAALLPAAERSVSTILMTPEHAKRMDLSADRAHLFAKFADSAAAARPWSVTFHRPTGSNVDAGPNDYYSEGPYWWPDPANPNGPYIRKDGERNPNRFLGNRNDLGSMCEAVLSLGMGALVLKGPKDAQPAYQALHVWVIDLKTR